MKKYIAIDRVDHDGQRYEPGEELELGDREAKTLLECGAVKKKPANKKSDPKK